MKSVKRILSLCAALAMVLALSVSAFAAEGDPDPTTPPSNAPGQKFSITVNNVNDAISIVGKTYKAYKVFDVTYNGSGAYSYTVSEEFAEFSYDGKSGSELVELLAGMENDSDSLNAFAAAALSFAVENDIDAAGSAEATAESVEIDVTAKGPGYYLVAGDAKRAGDGDPEETVTASCALSTTNPEANVNVKADIPSITKKIDKDITAEGENDLVDDVTSDVGAVVNFQLDSKVPSMTGYNAYKFVMNDTMTAGLTFNNDVKLFIGGTEVTTGYTVATGEDAGEKTFIITIDDLTSYEEGAAVVVTYSATVNAAALDTEVETNTVNLEYSNDPYNAASMGTTPDDTVYVYDFDILIDKYAEQEDPTDVSEKLADAEFVLYKLDKEDENKAYYYTVGENGVVAWSEPVTREKNTDAFVAPDGAERLLTTKDSKVSFRGLAEGTYYLQETAAPEGYNKLVSPVTVIISGNQGTAEVPSFTSTVNDVEAAVILGEAVDAESDNIYLIAGVANNTGSMLPSTGGMGTTIFYIVGGVMAVGACILLVTRRRMGNGADE